MGLSWHEHLERRATCPLCAHAAIRQPDQAGGHPAQGIAYLISVKPEDTAHIIIGRTGASRSAFLTFATFSAGLHPLIGVDEEGINVMQHLISCERHLPCLCFEARNRSPA